MLSPVRAASSSGFSSQGQTSAVAAGGGTRSIIAPAPVEASDSSDLNSAIAGKLNILLLTARERMVEALFDVIDAAGRAIAMRRDDSESKLAFAFRIADAIQQLPPANLAEIERQLSVEGHNLPLKMIAEALKNPTGPEAARIVAYFEIVRNKDRDLAARAVMRSYYQNNAAPARPEVQAEPAPHEMAPAKQPASAPAAAAILQDAPEPPTLEATEEPAFPVEVADPKAPVIEGHEELDAAPLVIAIAAEQPDAGHIESISLEARAEPLAEPEQALLAPPVETRPAVLTKADPVIPKNWGGIVASMTAQISDMIATIIREQEATTLLADTEVEAAVEIESILDEAVINDAKDSVAPPRISVADLESYQPQFTRPPIVDLTTGSTLPRQAGLTAHVQLPIIDVNEASTLPAATRIQDGVPYVQVPNQFAKETLHSDKAEAPDQRFRQDGGEGDEHQASADDEDGESQSDVVADADEHDDESQTERKQPEREIPVMAAGVVADPVYALYQRMVGWE